MNAETVEKMRVLLADLSGDLAESVALDMDHKNRNHSPWYRKVKSARKLLKTIQQETTK